MHIELIGCTSAGKTTLAREMVKVGVNDGDEVIMSDDFILQTLHLYNIRNEFLRRRIVELSAFATIPLYWNKYRRFFKYVMRVGLRGQGSWIYKLNRIRNVIRKIGIYEIIRQKATPGQIVLADNEGVLQGVHNLFVHENDEPNFFEIQKYLELSPLPDLVIYMQQDRDVLIERSFKRGHDRITKDSHEKTAYFISQAINVFEYVFKFDAIRDKLITITPANCVEVISNPINHRNDSYFCLVNNLVLSSLQQAENTIGNFSST